MTTMNTTAHIENTKPYEVGYHMGIYLAEQYGKASRTDKRAVTKRLQRYALAPYNALVRGLSAGIGAYDDACYATGKGRARLAVIWEGI